MKIIIEIDEAYHAEKLLKALTVWKKRVNAGGDSALAFHQYNSDEKEINKEEKGKMINCGYIGHDVIIKHLEMNY